MLNKEQIEFLLIKAYNAAVMSGARILDIYADEEDLNVAVKADLTLITQADTDSHELIKKYLSQTRIPLLSEEGRDMLYAERCNWDLFWMIDPLDGTREFIKGNGEFTVNIALMDNNEPVVGMIYVPLLQKLYFAIKGYGAYLKRDVVPRLDEEYTLEELYSDLERLPLKQECNDPIRIAVSRSHNTDDTWAEVAKIKTLHPDAEVFEQGSSYKFCLVAEGSAEVYIRTTHTSEWDTAAGDLILSEAGGVLRALEDGVPFRYNKESVHNPYFICCSHTFDPEV